MRTVLATTIVASALAGCLSSSAPEALSPQAIVGVHGVDLTGCDEQLAILPLPMADLQAQVPEGFEVLPFDPLGQFGVMAGIGLRCASVAGLAEGGGTIEMHGAILVVPPEEFRADGIETYGVPVGVFTVHQGMADTYLAWGVPSVDVTDITFTSLGPNEGQVTVYQGEGSAAAVTQVVATVIPAPQTAETARLFTALDGKVTGAIDFAWTASDGAQGTAAMAYQDGAFPLPLPSTGLGFHYFGDDYAFRLDHLPLLALQAQAGSARPVTGAFGVPFPQGALPEPASLRPLLRGDA